MDRIGAALFEEFSPLRRVAVCPPAHFELREPINLIQAAHVAGGSPIAVDRAAAQHARLGAVLRETGAEVVHVEPDPRFPYQINTRDAGLGTPHGLILGRFRLPVRQGEEELARRAITAARGQVLGSLREAAFEGGDFVALTPSLAAVGLGPRTQPAALDELRVLLGPTVELIGVPFAERYLHLDMIFNVVADRLALACQVALPPDFLAFVRRRGFRLLEVSDEEVFRHGCNVLAVGAERIISHPANGRVNALLRSEGLAVVEVDVSELAKSGGGPRCLTLPIERDSGG